MSSKAKIFCLLQGSRRPLSTCSCTEGSVLTQSLVKSREMSVSTAWSPFLTDNLSLI